MNIAIYIKTLDLNFNGCCFYGLNLAKVLSKNNNVYIFHCSRLVKNDLEDIKRRGIEFPQGTLVFNLVSFNNIYKYIEEFKCDLFINTCGDIFPHKISIPSFDIVHFPDRHFITNRFDRNNEILKRYIESYDLFLPNSNFTKHWLKEYLNVDGKVLYPIVDYKPILENELSNKENIILSVSRLYKDKKIIEMINVFKKLNINYKYIIAGGVFEKEYIDKINDAIGDSKNIELIKNPSHNEVVDLYKKSKIFWHAKGYQSTKPMDEEHFGIVTVEAMSQGCVPISFNGGGQPEIIDDSINGFLWNSPEELCRKTIALIGKEENYQISAIEKSKMFLEDEFEKNLNTIIYDYFNKGK